MGILPAGKPKPIVDRLNREIVSVVQSTEIKQRFESMGIEVDGSTPESVTTFMRSEAAKWQKIAKDAGVKVT